MSNEIGGVDLSIQIQKSDQNVEFSKFYPPRPIRQTVGNITLVVKIVTLDSLNALNYSSFCCSLSFSLSHFHTSLIALVVLWRLLTHRSNLNQFSSNRLNAGEELK